MKYYIGTDLGTSASKLLLVNVDGNTSLEELAAYAENMCAPTLPASGRQEYLQSIINEIMFK